MSHMQIYINTSAQSYPFFPAEVHRTGVGTPYLKSAGVAMIAQTATDLEPARDFINGFDDDQGFGDGPGFGAYLDDDPIEDAGQVTKFAGQTCYLSFGEKRSKNADAQRYLDHIKELGHGSVFEHASFTFLFYGIDRSVTHELVRHRHLSFSQTSQRYVDGSKLRFVERPEYQPDRIAEDVFDPLGLATRAKHRRFAVRIGEARAEYEESANALEGLREQGHPMLQGESTTELRKRLNQVARESLLNCTEAPIVVSGNARAWRGFIDQRATKYADVPIRDLAVKTLKCLQHVSPLLFGDYKISMQEDGTEVATTPYVKI